MEGQPNWDPNERYFGPTWDVLLTEQDRAGARHPNLEPQWVSRYELLWRTDGGREWNSLGTFDGNVDATTEVAHVIDLAFKGGLVCRYLRLVPLESEGGGALRIGVYGEPVDGQQPKACSRCGGRHGERSTHQQADDELPEVITYTLTMPSESFNCKWCLDGSVLKGCRCSYCMGGRGGHSARRLSRRLQAIKEVKDFLAHV